MYGVTRVCRFSPAQSCHLPSPKFAGRGPLIAMNANLSPNILSVGLTHMCSLTVCTVISDQFVYLEHQNCSLVTTLGRHSPVRAHNSCRPASALWVTTLCNGGAIRCAAVLSVQPCALWGAARGQCEEQGAKVIAAALGLKCYASEGCRAEVHCFCARLYGLDGVTPLYCLGGRSTDYPRWNVSNKNTISRACRSVHTYPGTQVLAYKEGMGACLPKLRGCPVRL